MTRFNTQLVHGLPVNDNNTGAVNPPIYNSSTYAVESVNAMPRWDYARSGNPTRDFLEKQIAQLEHGTRGFAFASGLAAIHAVLSIFKPGDRIVVGKNIYGGTYSLFNEYFAERGLEFDSVDTADYEALDAAISGRDRGGRAASAVYFETLTNPLLQINNVNRISAIAHRYGALSIVDNTFVTPYLQQPLDLGADIVIHSATKYLAGHSEVNAGLVVVLDDEVGNGIYFAQNRFGGVLAPTDATTCAVASRRWRCAWSVSSATRRPWRNTCWRIRSFGPCITRACMATATVCSPRMDSRGSAACCPSKWCRGSTRPSCSTTCTCSISPSVWARWKASPSCHAA